MENKKMRIQAIVKNQEESLEVLYQKMGDRWFAFSYVNDEVFIGSICQSEIDYLKGQELKFEKAFG